MEIQPHIGVGDLRFGATREQVEMLLGPPDSTERERWEDGSESIVWHFRLSRLELSFDSAADYRLSRIASHHPQTAIRGFNPIGLAEGFLLQRYPHLALRADGEGVGKNYVDEILDLSFWLERGGVRIVTAYPEYDARTDSYIWPLVPAND